MRSLARKESEESPEESDRKKLTSVTGREAFESRRRTSVETSVERRVQTPL